MLNRYLTKLNIGLHAASALNYTYRHDAESKDFRQAVEAIRRSMGIVERKMNELECES